MNIQIKPVIRSVAGDTVYLLKKEIVFGVKRYRWDSPTVFSAVIYFIKKGYLKNVYWLTGDMIKGRDIHAIEICQLANPLCDGEILLSKVDYIKLHKDGKAVVLRKPIVEPLETQNEQSANFKNFSII